MWEELSFCQHQKEPLVMATMDPRATSSPFGVVNYVSLIQPACNKCQDKRQVVRQKHTEYLGRKYNLVLPYAFLQEFIDNSWKRPEANHNCDDFLYNPKQSFDKYGDICKKCQDLNSTDIKHDDGSKTNIFLDMVVKRGCSDRQRFYMTHKGKPQVRQATDQIGFFLYKFIAF